MATPPLRVLAQAPAELTQGRLKRLGEGIGKVVSASEHWVGKRERTPSEVVALIVLASGESSGSLGGSCRSVSAAICSSGLPAARSGSPRTFVRSGANPTARAPGASVSPGVLTVSKATERVEAILFDRLAELAAADRFDEFEHWLEQLLLTRHSGWRLGLFSLDAHLKNYGIVQGRVVLIDPGGLTNQLVDIEEKLARERHGMAPHVRLGLEPLLADHPEIAARFDARWRETVHPDVLREVWAKDRLGGVTPPGSPPPPASPAGT